MSKEISISDQIYSDAEAIRRELGMTPDEFYDEAAHLMKSKYRGNITEQLNQLCEEVDTSVDPVLYALQEQALEKEEW